MKCYLVSGDNGVIIHQHYDRALQCQRYIRRSRIKRFECFEEAEEAALEHLGEIVPYYLQIPAHLELDQMVTIAKLLKEHKSRKEDN